MTNESLIDRACQNPPVSELPLKGYYGGKPKRFTVEFDDYSTSCIGNADGSVDLITAKLEKLYMGDASTRKDEGAQDTSSDAQQTSPNYSSVETTDGLGGKSVNHFSSEIRVLRDDAAQEINEHWDKATWEEKLAWFNTMAKRPRPPMDYWEEILGLANHFYAKATKPVSSAPEAIMKNDLWHECAEGGCRRAKDQQPDELPETIKRYEYDYIISSVYMSNLAQESWHKFLDLVKHGAKFIDIHVRKDAKEYHFQADFLKYAERIKL